MIRLFLLVAMVILLTNPCIAAELPSIGEPPPALTLPNLAGRAVEISDLSGRPTILTFFTSWSDTCKQELSDLQSFYKGLAPSLEVVAISLDRKSKTLQEFLDKNEYSFKFLIDKKLSSLNKYAILIIPTTFLINREGQVEKILVDYDDNVKTAIEDWLKP
ncbi:TlpA family protein disulfide reductase [Candidatus Saganbacteria bacterium]|nr:TlpA family protein disulfide reductase [Candidatus Saganbacteria bacterium]